MGAVSGLMGFGGGVMGTGVADAQYASGMSNPVEAGQIKDAYGNTQNSMQAQQGLLTQLQGQNGLGNQSSVYNQMQGVANGQGPNPAQAMLNQATGQNVNNQAAMMAGQRGASGNVGMMARQAAQQGAGTQQQAVGQGASMQANQSMNALNNMGSMANSMASNQIGQTNANTSAQQAMYNSMTGAQNSFNNTLTSNQNSVNAVNGTLANTQLNGQQAMIGGAMSAAGGMMGGGGKAKGGEILPRMAEGGDLGSGALLGGAQLSGAEPPPPAQSPYSVIPNNGLQHQDGGADPLGVGNLNKDFNVPVSTPQSSFGQFLSGGGAQQSQAPAAVAPTAGNGSGADAIYKGMTSMGQGASSMMSGMGGMMGGGGGGGGSSMMSMLPMLAAAAATGGQTQGAVPTMVSPGEKYLPPQAVEQVKQGASPMEVGETIPGKPKVGGAKDVYKNDTVLKQLEPGGVVVPRSKTKSKDPHKASSDFVNKILAKRAVGGRK